MVFCVCRQGFRSPRWMGVRCKTILSRPPGRALVQAIFLLTSVTFLVLYLFMANIKYVPSPSFLQTDTCPACYGVRHCKDFVSHISFQGWDLFWVKYSFLQIKNVFFADYAGNKKIVLKKLAHNDELEAFDRKVCNLTSMKINDCDVGYAMQLLHISDSMLHLVKGVSDMTHCPTQRLLDRISTAYSGSFKLTDKEQMYFLSTVMVNPESVLIQTFPKSEGWPFPKYYGSCGRTVAIEHGGKLLAEYHNAPWLKRVSLAWKILRIADDLTNKDKDFALYWTDLSYENLAVDHDGEVLIIDAENILVVDKTELANTKPKDWDIPEESLFDNCLDNCLSIRTQRLCSRVHADHNYYAACRNLLSPYAQLHGYPGGLLHDIPRHISDSWPLEYLLKECAKPSKPGGRIEIMKRLIDSLDRLQMVADPV